MIDETVIKYEDMFSKEYIEMENREIGMLLAAIYPGSVYNKDNNSWDPGDSPYWKD